MVSCSAWEMLRPKGLSQSWAGSSLEGGRTWTTTKCQVRDSAWSLVLPSAVWHVHPNLRSWYLCVKA